MTMRPKDFEGIAEALGTTDASSRTVLKIGDVCYAANGNFDRGRFENRVQEWRDKTVDNEAQIQFASDSKVLVQHHEQGGGMMGTAVISIGRNVGSVPLNDDAWLAFRAEVTAAALKAGDVYFRGTGTGEYDGLFEQSYTVVFAAPASLEALTDTLRVLAATYRQESIALTVGETYFVGGDAVTNENPCWDEAIPYHAPPAPDVKE